MAKKQVPISPWRYQSFVLPFSLKKEHLYFSRTFSSGEACADKGEEKKKEAGRAAKGQIHTLLRCHHPLAFPFSLKKEHAYFPQTKRVEDPEKADIYTLTQPPSFDFPFPLKKESVLTRRVVLSCGSIRDGKKKEDGKMAKKQVSTLLRSHSPLAFLFPLQKEHVHTWGLKERGRNGGKTAFSFVSPFLPEKRMCASLYTSNMATHMCRHGDGKKKRKDGEKEVIFLLFFSFPCKKICASLYTSNMATHMCIHGEWKEEAEMAKKSVSILLNVICLLDFLFPWKKEHVHTYSHTKWGRSPRNVCIHGGWKKRGRRGEKADVLPAH